MRKELEEVVVKVPSNRRSFFKQKARSLLFSNWLTQIFAFFVVFVCGYGIQRFGTGAAVLLESITSLTGLSNLLFLVFQILSVCAVIPLVYGLVYFECCFLEGNCSLANIFAAFGSLSMFERAYKLFFYVLFKLLLPFLPFLILVVYTNNFYYEGIYGAQITMFEIDMVFFMLRSLEIVLFYLAFVFGAKNFLGIYISVLRSDRPLKECFFVASVCINKSKSEFALLALSFLPICVLSLFTVGFLFLMYTFPYMLVTFVMYSKYLYEKEMTVKNSLDIIYRENENAFDGEEK